MDTTTVLLFIAPNSNKNTTCSSRTKIENLKHAANHYTVVSSTNFVSKKSFSSCVAFCPQFTTII